MTQFKDRDFQQHASIFPFLKRLFGYTKKYKKFLISFVIFVLLTAAAESVLPIVWMKLIDNAIVPLVNNFLQSNGNIVPDYSELWKYVTIYFIIGCSVAAFVFVFIYCAGRIQEFVMYDIRQDLFKKLQKLSFSFYDNSAVGWLMSRITSDSQKVTELISWSLIEAVWGLGMIFFCTVVMFAFNWKLALVVISIIPVLFLLSGNIRKLILKYSRESRRYNSEITASFNENISGIEVNKSMVQENRASSDFKTLSEKMRYSSFWSECYTALYTPIIIFGGSVGAALVIYFGGKMTLGINPEITLGTLAAFFGYATLIFEPVLDISRFYAQAQGCLSAGERIFSIVDMDVTVKDKNNSTDFDDIKGDIEFKNVSFYYEKNKPVIENMNFNVKAGQSIALVGETGGGKSTIINLVSRFYEPVEGKILIDGQDYMNKTINSLRKRLGIVLQTPHLFSGSVRDNIKYGNENATEEDIINALKFIGIEEYINRLDEEVGEGGENLSMGEKQLISFARAVLANPAIFIMDEATSSIDTLTEAKIQTGINEIIKNRTSFIIAHRLSTIKRCDRILVVKKGKIIEDGSHKELMIKKGYYYSLYTRQLREQREKEILEHN